MKPWTEFTDRLFSAAGASADRCITFSCGHVVDGPLALSCSIVACGPTSRQFDFSYERRNSLDLLDELNRCLSNVVNLIPGGVVVFFPSYDYEDRVFKYLKDKGYADK